MEGKAYKYRVYVAYAAHWGREEGRFLPGELKKAEELYERCVHSINDRYDHVILQELDPVHGFAVKNLREFKSVNYLNYKGESK